MTEQASAATEATIAPIEHVSHRYETMIALDNITIEFPPRVMVSLIGPDGVGKSTFSRLFPECAPPAAPSA